MGHSTKTLAAKLLKRGPHRVLVGDLSVAGLHGQVFTPENGHNLPAVAFAHHWMTPLGRYRRTLEHLASWGIVVAAPQAHQGLIPNHQAFASDLSTALDIAAHVRLGLGNVTVHPSKLGVAGHGMGGGVAILTGAMRDDLSGVAALFPTEVSPNPRDIAPSVHHPGLIVDGDNTGLFSWGDSDMVSASWGGPVVHRRLEKAELGGFDESRLWSKVGIAGPFQRSTQKVGRMVLTGFILGEIAGEKEYTDFTATSGSEAALPKTTLIDVERDPESVPLATSFVDTK